MQTQLKTKAETYASSEILDRLDYIDDVLSALYLMTSHLGDDYQRSPFRRIITIAADELECVKSDVERDLKDFHAKLAEKRRVVRRAVIPRPASEQNNADPILAAIAAYRSGELAFEAINETDFDEYGGPEAASDKIFGEQLGSGPINLE